MTDELEEALATALRNLSPMNNYTMDASVSLAQAALGAINSAGFVVVPKEPNAEILHALEYTVDKRLAWERALAAAKPVVGT